MSSDHAGHTQVVDIVVANTADEPRTVTSIRRRNLRTGEWGGGIVTSRVGR